MLPKTAILSARRDYKKERIGLRVLLNSINSLLAHRHIPEAPLGVLSIVQEASLKNSFPRTIKFSFIEAKFDVYSTFRRVPGVALRRVVCSLFKVRRLHPNDVTFTDKY